MPISSLLLDPSNARKHSEKNLSAIKGSLAKFGLQKPIVISKDNIVLAGNGTLAAAESLGWKDIGIVRSKLTGSEAIAYAIADNRTGELAEWDDDVLSKTLQGLKAENFDLAAIGFSNEDLAKWIVEPEAIPGCDEDEIPQEVETRCKLGDLWILEGHRLLCGDSTDVLAVERLMGGDKVDMVYTDPPYGMNAVSKEGKVGGSTKQAPARKYRPVIGDEDTTIARDVWNLVSTLEIPKIIIWGGNYFTDFLPPSPCWIVWDKERPKGLTFADGEVAWTNFTTPLKFIRHRWDGYHRASERQEDRVHPTQKPAFLLEWCLKEYGKDTKSVLDLFLGSGSTLIACEKTKRKCYGMEIDPHYCDVIIARWEKFTGKTATLQAGV